MIKKSVIAIITVILCLTFNLPAKAALLNSSSAFDTKIPYTYSKVLTKSRVKRLAKMHTQDYAPFENKTIKIFVKGPKLLKRNTRAAMRHWNKACKNIKFVNSDKDHCDIDITIGHKSRSREAGETRTYANSFVIPNKQKIYLTLQASIVLDKNVIRDCDNSELTCLITHELGHALGLNHAKNSKDIMQPYLTDNGKITKRDIRCIKKLY